jgi:hypothetical protein
MRLHIREIKKAQENGDYSEFDDLRDQLVSHLHGEDLAPFWDRVSPPVVAAPSRATTDRTARLVEIISVLCVT